MPEEEPQPTRTMKKAVETNFPQDSNTWEAEEVAVFKKESAVLLKTPAVGSTVTPEFAKQTTKVESKTAQIEPKEQTTKGVPPLAPAVVPNVPSKLEEETDIKIKKNDIPTSIAVKGEAQFEFLKRQARVFANSSMVPQEFQIGGLVDKKVITAEKAIANCMIVYEIAKRMGQDVKMVMDNIVNVHGKQTWRSQFVIALVNASNKFSLLKFKYKGEEGKDERSCHAYATEISTGEVLNGTSVSIQMAKDAGWYGKSLSKWPHMSEQMLMYRAAAFFGRIYAPELLNGMHTSDEIEDSESSYEVQKGTSSEELERILEEKQKPTT